MNSRRWSEPALRVSATYGASDRNCHRECGGPIRWPRDGAAALAAGGFTPSVPWVLSLWLGHPRLFMGKPSGFEYKSTTSVNRPSSGPCADDATYGTRLLRILSKTPNYPKVFPNG